MFTRLLREQLAHPPAMFCLSWGTTACCSVGTLDGKSRPRCARQRIRLMKRICETTCLQSRASNALNTMLRPLVIQKAKNGLRVSWFYRNVAVCQRDNFRHNARIYYRRWLGSSSCKPLRPVSSTRSDLRNRKSRIALPIKTSWDTLNKNSGLSPLTLLDFTLEIGMLRAGLNVMKKN